MSFIHELPDWPRLSWDASSLSALLMDVHLRQANLLGKMEALGFDLRAEANLTALTSNVVKSSAIEGESLDPEEVRSSIARRLGLNVAGLSKSSRDVEGVVEMILDATRKFREPLTEERLFAWHASLFPTVRSGLNVIAVGEWRPPEAGPMKVVSGPIGREKVHFEAPDAARLASEMHGFLTWFNGRESMDPLLKAGVAHFWFVTIHPFEDGNGRIARAIADMALARADGAKDRFYSMSTQIAAERKEYYNELESAQRASLDITRWLLWFLGCLGRAIDNAHQLHDAVLRKARLWQWIQREPINERQQVVINRLLDDFQGFLTTSKYAKLAKCSQDTALRDIRELLERGILVRNESRGRSTSYRVAEVGDGE